MSSIISNTNKLDKNGFCIIEDIYTKDEVNSIIKTIESVDTSNSNFKKTKDVFAIRKFLIEIPKVKGLVFNQKLLDIINHYFGNDYFIVKAIYFDKPQESNWFVSYHQDLTISVDNKIESISYCNWTLKQNTYAVQPPQSILETIYTIRIHLDDTDENNGSLKVLSGSHKKGICRIDSINLHNESEVNCNVNEGGIMLMRPLLFHSSNKTINHKKRRVIHLEFSNSSLTDNLNWSEFSEIPTSIV